MTRKKYLLPISLCLALLATIALCLPASSVSNTSTPRGVALVQLACGQDPSGNGPIFGPTSVTLATGSIFCDGQGYPGTLLLPPGKLYGLRSFLNVGTVDGSTPNVNATVYVNNNFVTTLTCSLNATTATCLDLVHQVIVKSGDAVAVAVNLPDSNTFMYGGTATLEESIYQ
jgi:hypothetical protein